MARLKKDSTVDDKKIITEEHTDDEDNPHKVTKKQVGLNSVTDDKQATKEDFDSHKAAEMPHQFKDDGKTYKYGIAMQDGEFGIIYEEVE